MITTSGKLIVIDSDGQEQVFALTQEITTIGSADANDIVIRQPQVSRIHAQIESSPTGYILHDLDSIKGTLVNNRKVKQANLVSNDVIQLGDAVLRFEAQTIATPIDATVIDTAIFASNSPTSDAEAAAPRPQPVSAGAETIIELQPGGARPPFFCVIARELDVPLFETLARKLGHDQPVYLLRPAATEDRSSPTTVEALASQYITAIHAVQATGPYYLGGFNVGGIVAFEVAQQLQSVAADVGLLALLDTPYVPSTPIMYWNYRSAQSINQAVSSLPLMGWLQSGAGQQLAKSAQALKEVLGSRLPTAAQRLEEDFVTFQTALTDRVYAINQAAIQSYKPQPYSGQIRLFLATESPVRYTGAIWDWHQIAKRGLDVRLISGSYASILREPDVGPLAEQLKALLAGGETTA